MAEQLLAEMMRYNNWANRMLLEACEGLDETLLDREVAGAYGSIRETLAHILRAETWYIFLLTGQRPQPPFAWDSKPDVAQLKAFAQEVGEALLDAAERVPLQAPVSEEAEDGSVWKYQAMVVYIQIVNHGVEHRTNITTVLNQEGLNPPEVDGWGYLNAAPERFALEKLRGAGAPA